MFYFVGFAPSAETSACTWQGFSSSKDGGLVTTRDLVDHLGVSERVSCWVTGDPMLQLRLLISGFLDGGDLAKLACLDGNYCGLAGRFPRRHLPLAGWGRASRSLPNSWPRRTTRLPAVAHRPSLRRFLLQQRFHYVPPLPKRPAGREGAPGSLDESLPGDKPCPWGYNVVYSSCLSTQAWGGRRAAAGSPHPRGCSCPCAATLTLFLPFSSLLSFSLSLLVLFGGCRAGSLTGMLWGNYAIRVAAGCRPGEHGGTGAGECPCV